MAGARPGLILGHALWSNWFPMSSAPEARLHGHLLVNTDEPDRPPFFNEQHY
jgi:hypothetical protein